jgi:hypothetical protein
MPTWPLQSECDQFYGNPRGKPGQVNPTWEAANIVAMKPPFRMTYAGMPIKGIRIHKKCSNSLFAVLTNLWIASGHDQDKLDHWGVSIYAGAFNYRLMRNGTSLSMHSWGCAIDLDPANNGMGDTTPRFANFPVVLAAFADEGWVWGGNWKGKSCDGMHWQAARVG